MRQNNHHKHPLSYQYRYQESCTAHIISVCNKRDFRNSVIALRVLESGGSRPTIFPTFWNLIFFFFNSRKHGSAEYCRRVNKNFKIKYSQRRYRDTTFVERDRVLKRVNRNCYQRTDGKPLLNTVITTSEYGS